MVTEYVFFRQARWPLWLQLVSVVIVALLLVNLLTVRITHYVVSEFLLEQLDAKSRSAFTLLTATATEAVITEDIPLLDTIAGQALALTPSMVTIQIENEQGSVLVHHFRQESTAQRELRHYTYKIELVGEHFGTVKIDWDIYPIQVIVSQHVTKVQLFLSTMLLLLAGLAILLVHWLTVEPIRVLTRYLFSLSEGQKTVALALPRVASRELAFLAQSAIDLLHMQQQQDQRQQELVQTRKKLQLAHQAALSANQAKSAFLAAMSHEIRTPMNAALGILDLLKAHPLTTQQRHLIWVGQQAGKQLLAIINDVLDFSKLEATKLALENVDFDLHQLLSQSIDLFRPQTRQKRLSLRLEISSEVPQYAQGDPGRLRQILGNLLNNSMKFTHAGTIRLNVTAKTEIAPKSGFRLFCEVEDTGIGVAEAVQTTLFEEFTMVDQGYSRRHEGTGLGLAICKRLVRLMAGQIGLKSQLGQGSTFFFDVALRRGSAAACAEEQNRRPTGGLPKAGTRILLVEDNLANQVVISEVLKQAELAVDMVGNGREAVEAVQKQDYELVLMDISMPEMDGMAATRAIRRLAAPAGQVPIVALTAHALAGDKASFLAAGMDDYLTKPIDRMITLQTIGRWVAGSQLAPIALATPLTEPSVPVAAPEPLQEEKVTTEPVYVDEAVLQQLVRDTTPDIVVELLTFYLEDSRQRLKKLEGAIKTMDYHQLSFETHTLGSSAAAHGNAYLHQCARQIEADCRQEAHSKAMTAAQQLPTIAEASFTRLEQRIVQGFTG